MLVLMNRFYFSREPRGHDGDIVARLKNPSCHSPCKSAKIVKAITLWTNHPLDGKTGLDMIFIATDIDILEVVKQTRPFKPCHIT